jgi:hypothetical protein
VNLLEPAPVRRIDDHYATQFTRPEAASTGEASQEGFSGAVASAIASGYRAREEILRSLTAAATD